VVSYPNYIVGAVAAATGWFVCCAALQLATFSSSTRTGGPLLQQLPAGCMTCLQLLELDIAEDEAAELKPVAAALQRLTGGDGDVLLSLF
jgi:hypothetical protein